MIGHNPTSNCPNGSWHDRLFIHWQIMFKFSLAITATWAPWCRLGTGFALRYVFHCDSAPLFPQLVLQCTWVNHVESPFQFNMWWVVKFDLLCKAHVGWWLVILLPCLLQDAWPMHLTSKFMHHGLDLAQLAYDAEPWLCTAGDLVIALCGVWLQQVLGT